MDMPTDHQSAPPAPDLYCVFGNPIAHSKSPLIHAMFARACGEALVYQAELAPLDAFAASLDAFMARGGRGANVTVPFKEEAFRLCARLSERARLAGAVNTLLFSPQRQIFGDNTDGAGLVRDIAQNQGFALAGRRILLLGAGGAARGVIGPLLAEKPAQLLLANRTPQRATDLLAHFQQQAASSAAPLAACAFAAPELAAGGFDLVINATSAGLRGQVPPLPDRLFAPGAMAYDMIYGAGETAFLARARQLGAARLVDGLGMLVEQAAEAFQLWRAVRPDTAPVLAALRASI